MKSITVQDNDGTTEVHARANPGGTYDTLCGLSTSDDLFHEVIGVSSSPIACLSCYMVYQEAKRFKESDFAKDLKAYL